MGTTITEYPLYLEKITNPFDRKNKELIKYKIIVRNIYYSWQFFCSKTYLITKKEWNNVDEVYNAGCH